MSAVPQPVVLVPLDGSELAEAVLPLAAAIARRAAGRLVVLTIPQVYGLDVAWYTAGAPDAAALVPMDDLLAEARTASEGYLDATAARLRAAGHDVDTVLADDGPPEAIVRTAREQSAALIAMVTHGRGGLDRWAFGSVTDKVLQTAEVPVLLARAGAPPPGTELGAIAVALDGSALAEAVLEPVAWLARAFGARVAVLHVAPAGGGTAAAQHEQSAAYLAGVQSRLSATGVTAEAVVLTGHDVADELLEHCGRSAVALLALTSHGRGGLARLTRGSVADRVIRHATLPILVARSRAAD